LESVESIKAQIDRLGYRPMSVLEVRVCLAATEFQALDVICQGIFDADYKDLEINLAKTLLSSASAPEMAPYVLELALKSKASKLAQQWLDTHPDQAIVGLLSIAAGVEINPIALGKTEFIEAARKFLGTQVKRGYQSLIEQAIASQPAAIATKIRDEVLAHPELQFRSLSIAETPEWFRTGIAELGSSKPKAWVSPEHLPPLVIDKACLSPDQVQSCLTALSLSTLESPLPLVRSLKAQIEAKWLDAFVWALFERWLTEGAPSKEKWAMLALGLLGSDAIALKLTPLIRNYPGENQFARAVLGLDCLRAIATDTALMQINGIAQKTKYKGLQARAEECMAAIARDRQLTQAQLEDRIIPDCGLDANGQRSFDFGTRQFYLALGADLKPVVKDENGKHLSSLPKPKASDDTTKVQSAIADWKLLKKQVSEVIKIQCVRLEQAMISERRWTWTEFCTLLANHPLATHLVQRIVWGEYTPEDRLLKTFRVCEDRTFANAQDEPFTPDPSSWVKIIHPVYWADPTKAQWRERLSDYEMIQPFDQISREVCRLTSEERAEEEIKRFQAIQIPGEMLAYTMEKYGWRRGGLHDHGDYRVHYKNFDQGNITAIVGEYEHQHVEKSSIYGSDAIKGCLFLVEQHQEPYDYPTPGSWAESHMQGKRLRLGEVPEIVISEVLRDLTALTTAAQRQ
jgi:hypothetical protein